MLTLLIAGAGIEAAIVIAVYVGLGIWYWWCFTSGALDEADEWSVIEDAVRRRRGD